MKPTKITSDNQAVRVYYGLDWITFKIMPGWDHVSCGHTSVGIAIERYADEAREAANRYLGGVKYHLE